MININIQGGQLAYILIDGGAVRGLDNGQGGTGPKSVENHWISQSTKNNLYLFR